MSCIRALNALTVASVLATPAFAQLPYISTTLLQSYEDPHLLYTFRTSSTGSYELAALNTSAQLSASDLQYSTLSSNLPFLDGQSNRSFTPVIARDGNIAVYTGDCAAGSDGAEIWSYKPATDPLTAGQWSQLAVSSSSLSNSTGGANYLSTGISFASVMQGSETASNLYILGGLCPFDNSTSDNWQEAASYSNTMLSIEADQDHSVSSYGIETVTTREPLIAQAGYALAPLSPTYSNNTDGMQTQQQDIVLLGGQTQTAWINMSRIALFSLPQESWSYIDVAGPDNSRTDLAVRADVTEIQPRSGHSAVLSEDGQTIIVFGGWVGEITNPAEPQLAILNVGSAYGGKADWSWTAPTTSGPGPASRAGVYGHGVALLPGNIMMISGGFDIPATASRSRRQTQASSGTYFFNITSNGWSDSYIPVEASPATSSQDSSTGLLSTTSQRAGLGAGIGIGILAVVALIGGCFWYRRRSSKDRKRRERDLNDLSRTAHRTEVHSVGGGIGAGGGDPYSMYYFPNNSNGQDGWRRAQSQEAERTGLLLDIPSPTRGLRRGMASRPTYNEGRMVRNGGYIHPIDEEEDEEEGQEPRTDDASSGELKERPRTADRASLMAAGLDPLGSNPVDEGSPSKRRRSEAYGTEESQDKVPEMQHVGHAYGHASFLKDSGSSSSSGGRVSPSKASDRTGSNLSDRSIRSNLSTQSSSAFSFRRNPSVRSAVLLNANVIVDPFSTPDASPAHEYPPDLSANRRRSGTGSSESFATAHSSFAKLQAEGQALLGGGFGRPESSAMSVRYKDNEDSEPEEFEMRPNRQRGNSILGNVRRAIGRTVIRTATGDSKRSLAGTIMTQRSASLSNRISNASPSPGFASNQPMSRESGSTSPPKRHSGNDLASPMTPNMNPSPPRRANSDASFWKADSAKRGSRAWEDSDTQYREGDDWGDPEERQRLEREASAEWDVEGAAGRRDVQISGMFTVPKQRLRIVNAEPDELRSQKGSVSERGSILEKDVGVGGGDEGLVEMETVNEKSSVKSLVEEFEEREKDRGKVLRGMGKQRAE